jgi:hypothetical protein
MSVENNFSQLLEFTYGFGPLGVVILLPVVPDIGMIPLTIGSFVQAYEYISTEPPPQIMLGADSSLQQ